ncbi:MAG: hypothetical protein ACI3ZD_16200 [Prevotella sp.]
MRFTCPHCGAANETEALCVPSPNWEAETHSDSVEYDTYEHTCDCGETINITLYNGFYDGSGEIDTDVEDLEVEEEYDDIDSQIDEYMNSILYNSHVTETMTALDAIETLSSDVKNTLYRVLYANLISCMESFLSDTLIHKVLECEDNKRAFVKGYKEFSKLEIGLSSLYDTIDGIDGIITKTLRDIIYHNLPKVKGIYKDVLGIDLGEIGVLCKCVNTRHDIVHRNGKTKGGEKITIERKDIEELAKAVSDMIENVESQIFASADENNQ